MKTIFLLLSASLLLLGVEKKEELNSVPIYIGGRFGTIVVRPKVKSQEAIKSKNVVKQKLDFSCGSAATATLFNYYLDDPLSEIEIIKGLFHFGNKEKIIRDKGFSLLDIKKLSNALGYEVKGFRTDVEGLKTLKQPAIVTIVLGSYKHFVILRGIQEGRVFLADPALGNTIMPIYKFERIWYKNIAMIILPKSDQKIDNKLAISEDDLVWIKADSIRNSLFLQQVQTFKTNVDF